jgi:flagellar protein FlaG
MLVDPITISVRNLAPPVQTRPSAEKETAQKAEEVSSGKGPDMSRLTETVAEVQKNLNMIHKVDMQFSVHEASGKLMVTVIDGSTGELIREVPPSEVLDLAAKIDEMIGLIFDKKV